MQFKNDNNDYINDKFVSLNYRYQKPKFDNNTQSKNGEKENFKNNIKDNAIKYFKLSIGEKYEVNPIEIALKKAENFIYIISPYINEDTMDLLVQKKEQNIDVKLICSYRTNIEKTDILHSDLKSFLKLTSKLDYSDFDKKSDRKKSEFSKSEYEKKEKNLKNFLLVFYLLIFFSPIILGLLYYFNQFSKFTLIPLGFIFVGSVISASIFKDKLKDIKKDISNLDNKLASELKKLRETISPNIIWNKFEPIITKNTYNSDYKAALIHTKLYIMDYKTDNYSGTKAFLSSANFTDAGLHHNHEFLFETTDKNLIVELKNYFNSFYKSFIEDPNLSKKTLTKEELHSELFKRKYIDYPENYSGKNPNEQN